MTGIDPVDYRLMRQLRSASAGPNISGQCKHNFAWKTISPSAQLMVDPKIGARAVIRDTHADAGRFLWSVLAGDEMYPVAEGRTDDRALAQSIAKAALHAYAENRVSGARIPTNFYPPTSTLLDDALQMTERTGRAGSQPSSTGTRASSYCGEGVPKPPRNSTARP
jgi:hypothetical protein